MQRLVSLAILIATLFTATAINNVTGRNHRTLGGKWDAIVDLYDQGQRMKVYENRTPQSGTDFYEYSFTGGLRLDVPGDWNSQLPELNYYEGTVWYGRHFEATPSEAERVFINFSAVSYRCNVYLNGCKIATHEGGFTPFDVDVTDTLKEGDNFLVVEVNNRRTTDAIPALAFDWWNYGGITRDVDLVTVPRQNHIADYFITLDPNDYSRINVEVTMYRPQQGVPVSVEIPALGKKVSGLTDTEGKFKSTLKDRKLTLWAPDSPYLYDIAISADLDTVADRIGFRHITTRGEKILINGREQFMRSVSFHEEIPQRRGRAFSASDAAMLLGAAKELGVNMVRLAHYPQSEYTVRLAEEMGILLWEEIPIWQGIDFTCPETLQKARQMLTEMINRDKNRCAVGFWGVANETKPSAERNEFLKSLLSVGRAIDTTRLYTAAFDLVEFDPESRLFKMNDPFIANLDVVAVNKYMGWYHPWPLKPSECVWDVAKGKPLIISEFGGEALQGNPGQEDVASSWGEDYQAKLYADNLAMFENIPNLAGVSPWILFDFRSPFRFHPTNQEGWNRKGLISDRGHKKKAWHIMHKYYISKMSENEK